MKTEEGDEYAETQDNQIGVLVDCKLKSNYKNHQAYIWVGTEYYGVGTKVEV